VPYGAAGWAMESAELSSVEGQRVMQVLEETLDAARLASCATPVLQQHVSDHVGPEVTAVLAKHVGLLAEYEDCLRNCGDNPRSKDMLDITLRVQDSVRTLSRLPGKFPNLVDKLMVLAMNNEVERMIVRCEHTFAGLKQLTFQRLITTVEEENSRWESTPSESPMLARPW
jgi:hypothetical protein